MKPLVQSSLLLAVPLLALSLHGSRAQAAAVSIGVNFSGGGAHGAPTLLARDEEAGVVPQLEWNNLGLSGATNVMLRDTAHHVTAITLTYSSSGNWGSGS